MSIVLDREPVKQKNPPRQKEIHYWCMTKECPFARCGVRGTGITYAAASCAMCEMLKESNVFHCATCRPPH